MNHIKTMLCGNLIGINKQERLKLLQSDPLVNEFAISIKEPETVSRFWETSVDSVSMGFRKCYTIENISKILRQLKKCGIFYIDEEFRLYFSAVDRVIPM